MNITIVFPPFTYFDSASIQIGHMISILKEECEISEVRYRDYKSEQFRLYDQLVSSIVTQYREEIMEICIPHVLKDELKLLVSRAVSERILEVQEGTEHLFKLNSSLLNDLEKVYRTLLESMLNRIEVASTDVLILVPPYYITEPSYHLASLAKQKDPDICIMVFDYYNLQPGTPYITTFLTDTNFHGEDVSQLLQLDPLYPVLKKKIPQYFDYIVIGEGYDVLRYMFHSHRAGVVAPPSIEYSDTTPSRGSISRESCRSRDSVLVIESGEVAMDSLPMPDYSEMRNVYSKGQIELTRGCPYTCLFCESSVANSFRKHSVEYFLELLDHVQRYRFEYLTFWDPAVNTDADYTVKALKEVKDNNLITCKYTAQLRAQPADSQLITLLKETGCDLAGIGMENANARVIDTMHKNYAPKNLETLIRLLGENNITALLYTLIAYPTEKLDDTARTVSFLREASTCCTVDIALEPYEIGQVQRLSYSKYKEYGICCAKPTPETVEKATVLQTSPGIYAAISYTRGMNRKEYHEGLSLYRELAKEINLNSVIPG